MCRTASPPRARGSTSCVRRRGARSCAEIRQCRAAAAPDRFGFDLAQAVGVALQRSWPRVRIVVPKLHPQQKSWSLPTQMRTETRSKFKLSIRSRTLSVITLKHLSHPPKNFTTSSTGQSNFVTACLYQSSRSIGISHIRHDQAIGPDDTRQRIDGLNSVHVYLSKHSPRSETSLRTCGRRLLARRVPAEC